MFTITLFFVSLIATMFLFVNKARQLNTGKPYIVLSYGSDADIQRSLDRLSDTILDLPRILGRIIAFYTVKFYLKVFEKVKGIIYPRISHIVDAVKGKDIPKNRGAVSVYWTTVAERGVDR